MQVPSYGGNRSRENWVRSVFSFDHQSGSITPFSLLSSPALSFFFPFFFVLVWTFKLHFCRLRMTHSGRMAGVSGPGLRSLIAFPLLFANDSNDQDPPRWPILHGGGKITAGSTCSVLLRRNYFPNSICSKFGGPLRIFHESFPKRNTLSNGCNQ